MSATLICISAWLCSMMVQACGWCWSAGSHFAPTSGQQDHSCRHCDEAVAAWWAEMQTTNAAPIFQALSVKQLVELLGCSASTEGPWHDEVLHAWSWAGFACTLFCSLQSGHCLVRLIALICWRRAVFVDLLLQLERHALVDCFKLLVYLLCHIGLCLQHHAKDIMYIRLHRIRTCCVLQSLWVVHYG